MAEETLVITNPGQARGIANTSTGTACMMRNAISAEATTTEQATTRPLRR